MITNWKKVIPCSNKYSRQNTKEENYSVRNDCVFGGQIQHIYFKDEKCLTVKSGWGLPSLFCIYWDDRF